LWPALCHRRGSHPRPLARAVGGHVYFHRGLFRRALHGIGLGRPSRRHQPRGGLQHVPVLLLRRLFCHRRTVRAGLRIHLMGWVYRLYLVLYRRGHSHRPVAVESHREEERNRRRLITTAADGYSRGTFGALLLIHSRTAAVACTSSAL